jgi:hypothetical protein
MTSDGPQTDSLPASWDEAETLTKVAFALTGSDGKGKDPFMRFSEYYYAPIVDYFIHIKRKPREEAEILAGDFLGMLELPLLKGNYKGFARKNRLRSLYNSNHGRFREYLAGYLHFFSEHNPSELHRGHAPIDSNSDSGSIKSGCDNKEGILDDNLQTHGHQELPANTSLYFLKTDPLGTYENQWKALYNEFYVSATQDGIKAARNAKLLYDILADRKSVSEIAKAQGVTQSAVSQRLDKAVVQFSEWLAAYVRSCPSLAQTQRLRNYLEEIQAIPRILKGLAESSIRCCLILAVAIQHEVEGNPLFESYE